MQLSESHCHGIDCIHVELGPYEMTLTESFGPRVLRFGFARGENVFGEHPGAQVETELGVWRPLGGHRLWVAPEAKPVSYAPDDHMIEIEEESDSIDLIAPTDAAGFRKQITISSSDDVVTLDHTVTNDSNEERRIAAWTLTIMRGGGVAYLPLEPFKSHAEELLPQRQLIMWGYTDFTDPRWKFGKKHIALSVDERYGHPQKIGAGNKQGWLGYRVGDLAFVKSFSFESSESNVEYPDMGSNCEIYTGGSFVELESLSPLKPLAPGESVTHQEKWLLERVASWPDDEDGVHEIFERMKTRM
jgi:hypothetical protein